MHIFKIVCDSGLQCSTDFYVKCQIFGCEFGPKHVFMFFSRKLTKIYKPLSQN